MSVHGVFARGVGWSPIWLVVAFSCTTTGGQIVPNGVQMKEVPVNVFQPAPSDIRKPLMRARKAIDEGRYGDAAYALGMLLAAESVEDFEAQDYFLADSESDQPKGESCLKAEAQRLIGSLPAQGRQAYELQFGAQARALLDQAKADGNMEKLAEAIRKFFHTRAGYEASMLAGRFELGRGRPLAAALYLQRLVQTPQAASAFEPELSFLLATCWSYAGMQERARQALLSLKRRFPDAKVGVGGREVPLFSDGAQALAWLDGLIGPRRAVRAPEVAQWTVFRGNAQRNGRARGGRPLLNYRWRNPTCVEWGDEKMVEELTKRYRDERLAALPVLQPLAVAGTVVMRTPRKLLGVDLGSGKRVWEFPPWDDRIPDQTYGDSNRAVAVAAVTREHEMHQRIWDDAAHGQLSSDGKSIFLLNDLGYVPVGRYSPQQILIGMRGVARTYPGAPRPYNELVSLSLARQGAAQWIVGGENGEDEPKLAGAFFLGPPLPMDGKLYAMAEFNGEIRLVVLDAHTGRLDWQQQLAHVDVYTIMADSGRRLAGATPSFEGGVLLCPTSAGALVAVDVATRSLLWGYQYYRVRRPVSQRGFGFIRFQPRQNRPVGNRWADATVTVADGRVLLTVPADVTSMGPDADELHCLDLLTGEPVWKPQKRGDRLFLACVHDGKAVFVGSTQVTAIGMDDGQPAWSGPIELDDPPSGRGFYSDHYYYLPTNGKELLQIDLSDGKLQGRCLTAIVLGNLICYQDQVISQGPDWLAAFYQTEPLKQRVEQQLADDPDDVEALTKYGELLLQKGDRREAIQTLRKAHQLEPEDDTARTLLVTTLLDTLRDDFSAGRAHAAEIERLLDRPSLRSEYLILMARGWQREGATAEAFEACQELAHLKEQMLASGGASEIEVDRVEKSLRARVDRWLQARLMELLAAANAAERERIEATVRQRMDRAKAEGEISSLRGFLRYFGAHPSAEAMRLQLATRLIDAGELLEAEQLLARLERRAADGAVRAPAVAEMARLLERERCYEEALGYYGKLASEWADTVCRDGKTGKQVSEPALASQPLKEAQQLLAPWPKGKVEVTETSERMVRSFGFRRVFASQIRQRSGPAADGWNIFYDQQRRALVVRDARGTTLANIGLGTLQLNTSDYSAIHARIRGHLLMVSLGVEILAIDMLQAARSPTEAILWRRRLVHPPPGMTIYQTPIQVQALKHPWGGARRVFADAQRRLYGATGPLLDIGAYYLNQSELVCADPLTGDAIWVREGLRVGSDVFGDDELIFVVPPDSGEARVFNALDGSERAARTVDPLEHRWTTLGRNVLAWEQDADDASLRLRLYDAWTGRDVWREELPTNTKATLVQDDEIAVLQPDGRLVVRSLRDDRIRLRAALAAEASLLSVHVLRSREQYVVVTNRTVTIQPNTQAASALPINSASAVPLVTGNVYAFDRATGKPSWKAPVAVERFGFAVDQPAESPVLLFLRHLRKTQGSSRRVQTSMLCLDRRDGRVLFQKDDIPVQTYTYDVAADRLKQTVRIGLPNKTITIKMTDEPVAADAPSATSGDAPAQPETKSSPQA